MRLLAMRVPCRLLRSAWQPFDIRIILMFIFGAGSGLGLPIIGRLLGHAQAATAARYAHIDNDPLRRAWEAIAERIAAASDGNRKAIILPLRGSSPFDDRTASSLNR
jgi:integrase